jgi:RimJ/RimL family protein N-acetyltransferase
LREHWSRGFAYEAACATLEYGRSALGLKLILSVTSPGNQPSIKLLEKLGFHYQKTIRIPPVDRDTMLFSNEGF